MVDGRFAWAAKRLGIALIFAGAARYYLNAGATLVHAVRDRRAPSALEATVTASLPSLPLPSVPSPLLVAPDPQYPIGRITDLLIPARPGGEGQYRSPTMEVRYAPAR